MSGLKDLRRLVLELPAGIKLHYESGVVYRRDGILLVAIAEAHAGPIHKEGHDD